MEIKKLEPEVIEKAANMLKAVAHPVRIAIVQYLEDGDKRTVQKSIKSWGSNNRQLLIIL